MGRIVRDREARGFMRFCMHFFLGCCGVCLKFIYYHSIVIWEFFNVYFLEC